MYSLPVSASDNLKRAAQLTTRPSTSYDIEGPNKFNENIKDGIGLFNRLCLDVSLTPSNKLDVICCYLNAVPDQGQDMICRWRDMVPFLKNDDLKDMVELLCKITKCPDISSHERIITAVSLYNNCFLHICYDCFTHIAYDRGVLVNYRVEACRYLYGSQDIDNINTSQDILLEIINTKEYQCMYRYKIIAGFISKTGISTKLNFTKLRVPYSEDFVYGLQIIFFGNTFNGVRERILSGQHILQMEKPTLEEKEKVETVLLEFASSTDLDDNTRADASDVLIRLGSPEFKIKAREIITSIGFSAVDSKKSGIGLGSLAERSKTIYQDSQNIHKFQDQIDSFIEKIIKETDITIKSFSEVHNEVTSYIRKMVFDREKKFKIFRSLNRISIDTARFTSHNVTLAEIFVHVWIRILKYDLDKREYLKTRMIDELADMDETCSSGHSGRFVNILSEVDISLTISWDEQIKSNMTGRMMALIRDCPDEELRSSLSMAESELADDKDKELYRDFIKEHLISLENELRDEFVGGGHVSDIEFDKSFKNGTIQWF